MGVDGSGLCDSATGNSRDLNVGQLNQIDLLTSLVRLVTGKTELERKLAGLTADQRLRLTDGNQVQMRLLF